MFSILLFAIIFSSALATTTNPYTFMQSNGKSFRTLNANLQDHEMTRPRVPKRILPTLAITPKRSRASYSSRSKSPRALMQDRDESNSIEMSLDFMNIKSPRRMVRVPPKSMNIDYGTGIDESMKVEEPEVMRD